MTVIPALVLGIIILWLPGTVLLRGLARVDLFTALACAAPLSVGFVSILGLWPRRFGGFRPATAVVAVLLLLAAVAATRLLRNRRTGTTTPEQPSPERLPGRAAWFGAGAGSLVSALVWWPILWPTTVIPQDWDAIWHGYVSAVIRNTHMGNPFGLVPLDPMVPGAHRVYYPTGVHLVVDLASTANATVVPALNAVQFLFAVLVLPLGVAALAREVLPRQPIAVLTAPVIVATTVSFAPRLTGIIPFMIAMTMVPAVLTLLLLLRRRGWDLWLGAISTLATMALVSSQPAVAISVAIVGGIALLDLFLRVPGPLPRRTELARIVLWASAALLVAVPWLYAGLDQVSAGMGIFRPPYTTIRPATTDLLTLTWNGAPPAPWWFWLPIVLALFGLIRMAISGATTWPLITYVVFGILFVVAAGLDDGLRRTLTTPWVGDWYRLLPLVALAAGLGLAAAFGFLLEDVSRLPDRARIPGRIVATGIALVLIGAWGAHQVAPAHHMAAQSRDDDVIPAAEVAAYRWLRDNVPPGTRVLNDWSQSTSWMYAVSGVVPLEPYVITIMKQPQRASLVRQIAENGNTPELATALHRYRIEYVIVSRSNIRRTTPNLTLPPDPVGMHVVFENSDSTIYRLDPTR